MQKANTVPKAILTSEKKRWLLVLVVGLLGALINTAPVPLLPEIKLILGNAAYAFIAMHLLPRYAVVTAVITVIPLYFLFGYSTYLLVFIFEAFFIATMRSRGWYILLADMVYWLCIGMPIVFLCFWIKTQEINSINMFTVFKHAFNGLWYTCLACFIMFILSQKFKLNWQHQSSANRTLRAKLMYSLVFVTIIALFSATLLVSNHFLKTSRDIIGKSLEDSSQNITLVIDAFIDKHARAVYLASDWLSSSDTIEYKQILDRVGERFPQINALYITNDNQKIKYTMTDYQDDIGKLIPSTVIPEYELIKVSEQEIAIKSSPVFSLDLDGAKKPVIALNTSFHSIKNNHHYDLQAILKLSKVEALSSSKIASLNVNTLLVDGNGKIIHASPDLDLTALETFEFKISKERSDILILKDDERYNFRVALTSNGWKVYSLVDYYKSTDTVKEEYLIVFIILFFTLIITAYFADQFGRRLTKPIHFIIEQLTKYNNKKMPSGISASLEVIHLYEEIMSNRDKLYEYQELLEEKVVERTKELNEANTKLEQLALFDSLTQVHNRRYLDDNFTIIQKTADRNTALMSLIMVDLDFFKKLNDQYGHLVGDNCLTEVAQLIKKGFDRASDIVVRFGGEEFVVVAPYITPASLAIKIEQLRKDIESYSLFDETGNEFHITASFGAVIADAAYSEDVLHWLKKADECLYEAKGAGRNCYRISDKVSRLNSEA